MRLLESLVLLVVVIVLVAAKVRYDGYQLIRTQAKNEDQIKALRTLERLPGIDFWKEPGLVQPADIAVPPQHVGKVVNLIKSLHLSFEVAVDDIQRLIDEEEKQNSYAKVMSTFRSGFSGLERVKKYYMRLNDIYSWMNEMVAQFPNAKVVNYGKSYEGRYLKALKIGDGNKPTIFIDSGIHAREWISVSTNLYMMYELLMGSKTGKTNSLLERFDWIFVPVVNPDGYEYSFEQKRMWRKNRRPMGRCVGADPNRNFDIEFGGAGSSFHGCDLTYPGPHAFSEPCALALAQFILKSNENSMVKAYMSLHAYSQMWFVPYGFNRWRKPADIDELLRVAKLGAQAIRRTHGKVFKVGTPGEILYDAAGSTMDWVKAKTSIKYSYAMELRPEHEVRGGFVAPPSEIVPAGEEMWEGMKAMAENMR